MTYIPSPFVGDALPLTKPLSSPYAEGQFAELPEMHPTSEWYLILGSVGDMLLALESFEFSGVR